jgi:hypothetical protein
LVAHLAVGTLAILGMFLVLVASFTGVGLLLRHLFKKQIVDISDYFVAFWTGYGLVVLFLIVWNFFLPVGLPSFLSVLVFGGVGWWLGGVPKFRTTDSWRPTRLQIALIVLGSLWVANHATGDLTNWDDGLYHLQAVEWAGKYAVVPGIANLLGPLAFNNASFLYDAMLDSGWWKDRGFHLANGVLVFVLLLRCGLSAARFASRREGDPAGRHLFGFILLAPLLNAVRNGELASYSTDIPSNMMLFAAAGLMYELLDSGALLTDAYSVVSLTILLSSTICLKLSSAVFAGVAISVVIFLSWKSGVSLGSRYKAVAKVSLIAAAFVLPWMARGVMLSGYPLYPVPLAGFPVSWRAPLEHTYAEYAYIGFTEREFTWRFIGRDWLRQIFLNDSYAVFIPATLAALAILGLFLSSRLRQRVFKQRRATWWLALPAVTAIAGWLWSAPSTRYSPVLFWTFAATVISEYLLIRWPELSVKGRSRVLAALVLLGVSPCIVMPAFRATMQGQNPAAAVANFNFVPPPQDHWIRPIMQPPNVVAYTTRAGLVLNVPRKPEDSTVRAKCWNAPIPCTPNPAPNLQLINPGRLDGGFKVEGSWQMQDWPNYWQRDFLAQWRARNAETIAHLE